MVVNAIVCKKCNNVLFSRNVHDYRECDCGLISIDGGFDYVRICGDENDFEEVRIVIDATMRDIDIDWNYRFDKLGKYPDVTYVTFA